MNKSFNFNVFGLCENELECVIKKEINCSTLHLDRRKRTIFDDTSGKTEILKNMIRIRRNPKLENILQRERIEIKFTLLGEFIQTNL